MRGSWIRVLFVVAALYDGILGLVFLVVPGQLFDMFHVTLPNHFGYVRFPALLLLIFAAMYAKISTNPVKYRVLMPYGMGLKVAYSGTVFFYGATSGIPSMWLPWAWCDLLFLFLFVVAWLATGREATSDTANKQ